MVAGVAFLIPGFLLILGLAYFYQQVIHFKSLSPLMEGMRAAALFIIFDSVWRLFRPYTDRFLAWVFVGVGTVYMFLLPRWEPLVILAGGFAMVLAKRFHTRKIALAPLGLLLQLFWIHFKAGTFVFGTGLAIIPFLEHEVVAAHRWLTQQEFIDAIAFGQLTPGPITISSVFIGYRAGGFAGALASAAGMYLPGLFFILVLLPLFKKRLDTKAWLGAFQLGAIPMVIGCLLGASLVMAKSTLISFPSWATFMLIGIIASAINPPAWSIIPMGCALCWFLRQVF